MAERTPEERLKRAYTRICRCRSTVMGEYDITTSYLFRHFPRDFVGWIVQGGEFVELADTALKQIRYPDAIAWVKVTAPDGVVIKILSHLEFQTDADDGMPRRMVGYIGRIVDAYDAPVDSTVIYLRPQEINDPGIYHYIFPTELTITYRVMKICEVDGGAFLENPVLGLLPLTPLMQKPAGVTEQQWLRKCIQTIEASTTSEQERKELIAGTGILAGLIHNVNFVRNVISEEIMLQSSVVQELLKSEDVIRRSPVFQKLLESEDVIRRSPVFQKLLESEDVIRQSPIVNELIQEEHQKAYAQSVIFTLEAKLGALGDIIKNRILSIQDEEQLTHLLRQSVIADKSELEREIYQLIRDA